MNQGEQGRKLLIIAGLFLAANMVALGLLIFPRLMASTMGMNRMMGSGPSMAMMTTCQSMMANSYQMHQPR